MLEKNCEAHPRILHTSHILIASELAGPQVRVEAFAMDNFLLQMAGWINDMHTFTSMNGTVTAPYHQAHLLRIIREMREEKEKLRVLFMEQVPDYSPDGEGGPLPDGAEWEMVYTDSESHESES